MLSPESEVLERHLALFKNRQLLLFGNVRDDFSQYLSTSARQVQQFSCYFDYARHRAQVEFGIECYARADLAVFYWTKNKQECQFQLLQWLSLATSGQEMLIIGENRAGVRSAESLLKAYGDVAKIDSARRCSLYHFRLNSVPRFNSADFWQNYTLDDLQIFSLPAVFSSAGLDHGTRLLLSTFQSSDKLKGSVLDLGCGAGLIGAYLKKRFPAIELTQSDIHAMALASAERTLAENGLTGRVVASDVFSDLDQRFDLIVSNPPFHDGIDTAYRAVEDLIAQAKHHLRPNGELRIVANAFLPYPDLLDRAFGKHQVLAKSNTFKVYSAKI